MEIHLHEISVREIFAGYINDESTGQVVAYGGKLNVRPAYQREFVYNENQQKAVLSSILQNFPLNVMYWSENEDGSYEMIDGQQRTLSICEWLNNGYSISANPASPNIPYYAHTSKEVTARVLSYKLMIYICKGTQEEKLNWFKVINFAGEQLTTQELRNAIYTGPWLADAKAYFSKRNCIASKIGDAYMAGSPIRQDYLETILSWISAKEGKTIEEYMAEHQHDSHATPLKQYFASVIDWIKLYFPTYRRKLMKGLDWGILYNKYAHQTYDPQALEEQIQALLQDDDVTKQKGIYEYLLNGRTNEKVLSIRAFTDNEKQKMFARQKGVCPMCANEGKTVIWTLEQMHADHIIPWSRGGHTTLENGQMLCRDHNLAKSNL